MQLIDLYSLACAGCEVCAGVCSCFGSCEPTEGGWPFLRGQARDLLKFFSKETYIYVYIASPEDCGFLDRAGRLHGFLIIGEAAWWTTVCHLSVRGGHGLLQSWLADYGLLSQ